MKYTIESLIELVTEAGLKNTQHRLAVLTRISKAKTPIAVHKVVEDLKKKSGIDQATVYRNLSLLEESKIIRRFDYNHGHAHYEMNVISDSHRLICKTCETIEKIAASYFDLALKKLAKKSRKFRPSTLNNVEIYGLCKSCG